MAEPTIHTWLAALRSLGGSDLHLSPGEIPRVRKNGTIVPMTGQAELTAEDIDALITELRRGEIEADLATKMQADFGYDCGADLGRFRINVSRKQGGWGLVARAIPLSIPSAEDLGLPPAIQNLARLRDGLVLVTGSVGSGKSTTLSWIIDQMNRTRGGHIITVEDPVEYRHPNLRAIISQREVGPDVPSFELALEAALRQDPDVIVVGEIRTRATLALALSAAETGRLVLGTLHSTTAEGAITRMLDLVETNRIDQTRRQIADAFQAIISQRLLPTVEGTRRAAIEILLATPATRQIIRAGKESVRAAMKPQEGMQTMDQALIALAKGGWIPSEMALQQATDTKLMENQLLRREVHA